MRAELRLARHLLVGSDRREWWRIALTAFGALLATGLALAAVVLATVRGTYDTGIAHGLLDRPGERRGVATALLFLLLPVLGFLGQCARIGAVHRDRRLAGLRLAGASPWQVRRIAAAETGLACLAGSALGAVVSVLLLLTLWERPTAAAWAGIALVTVAVPVAGALVSVVALRRVAASPLGWVRRVRPRRGPGALPVALVVLLAGAVLGSYAALSDGPGNRAGGYGPLVALVLLVAAGALVLWLVGATARLTGTLLAARTGRPAVLIAAQRLRDDPWAAARTHAAVLLVTLTGTAFVGVRRFLIGVLDEQGRRGANRAFYTTGIDLTAAAIGVALAVTLLALAVGAAESSISRRRGLAAQVAAGVPRAVLGRALLLETALPLAPAVLLAGGAGMAIGAGYAGFAAWAGLLVPVAVYAACLLAAAASLPLLRRATRPGELRYA